MTIQVDSREKSRAIQKILGTFNEQNIQYFVSKLPVGDYSSLDNPRLAIDRKQNLFELCSNVCQQHARFRAELERAQQYGIKLVILCEHGGKIKSLDDVLNWENPRLKQSPLAVSGERLYKILSVMSKKYGVDIYFCNKKDTGRKIIELLGGEKIGQANSGSGGATS